MFYDPNHNILFLKNGRAGSTSIELALQHHLGDLPGVIYSSNDRFTGDNEFPAKRSFATAKIGDTPVRAHFRSHETYSSIVNMLPAAAEAKVFTSFRNPLARVWSWWEWERQQWGYTGTFEDFVFKRWTRWENDTLFLECDTAELVKNSKHLHYPWTFQFSGVEQTLIELGVKLTKPPYKIHLHRTHKTWPQVDYFQERFIRGHCQIEAQLFA